MKDGTGYLVHPSHCIDWAEDSGINIGSINGDNLEAKKVKITNLVNEAYRLGMAKQQEQDKTMMALNETLEGERILRLVAALKIASQAFRFYEEAHNNKTPPDLIKTAQNRSYAIMCEKAIQEGENDGTG